MVFRRNVHGSIVIRQFISPCIVTYFTVQVMQQTNQIIARNLLRVQVIIIANDLTVVRNQASFRPVVRRLREYIRASTVVLAFILRHSALILFVRREDVGLYLFHARFRYGVIFLKRITLVGRLVPPIYVKAMVHASVVFNVFATKRRFKDVMILFFHGLITMHRSRFPIHVQTTLNHGRSRADNYAYSMSDANEDVFRRVSELSVVLHRQASVTAEGAVSRSGEDFS